MPAPSASPAPARRIGLREVARASGVCLRTASLALQESTKISEATRQRVRQHAARIGYQADPEISRLMGRLRQSRASGSRVLLAMIDPDLPPAATPHPYDVALRRGVTAQADALGFGVTSLRLGDHGGDIARLLRFAREQGITGLLLLPTRQPVSLDPQAGWEGFSVVAVTTSIVAPRFHQVTPNQFHNMRTLVETLQARGRKRIGAILSETLEQRTTHTYSLALTWHGHRERILILPSRASAATHARRVAQWAQQHQPDAVLLAHDAVCYAPLLLAKTTAVRPELTSLSASAAQGFDYLDQQPGLIGESAVGILTGMMHRHETGIPAHPQITAIEGVFRGGRRIAASSLSHASPSSRSP